MGKKGKKKEKPETSKVWAVMALVSGIGSSKIAKKALNTGWKAASGKEPPTNPADPDVAMAEAVAWAAFSGTFVALAKMLATRRAANYYVKSTGELPPQLRADKPEPKADESKTNPALEEVSKKAKAKAKDAKAKAKDAKAKAKAKVA